MLRSSNPAVASVGTAGSVTGRSPGQASITASSGGMDVRRVVTVVPVAVAWIEISPTVVVLDPGTSTPLSAALFDRGVRAMERVTIGRGTRMGNELPDR